VLYGLVGARLLDRWLTNVTGFPVNETLALPVAFLSLAVVAGVALAVAAVPGWFAARVPTTVAFHE
jgi:putative ABC transport system permease protein